MGSSSSVPFVQAGKNELSEDDLVGIVAGYMKENEEKVNVIFAKAKILAEKDKTSTETNGKSINRPNDNPTKETNDNAANQTNNITAKQPNDIPNYQDSKNKPDKYYLQDSFSLALLKVMNRVRENPKSFAAKIEREIIPQFDANDPSSKIRNRGNGKVKLQTMEGIAAVQECIEVLKNAKPLEPFQLAAGMSRASEDHVNDIGPKGVMSHTGSDGSSAADRTERYGSWRLSVGENISFGAEEAEEVVTSFLINDGVKSRSHRKNILNPEFRVLGVGKGPHKLYENCCVLTFAGGYGPKLLVLDRKIHVSTDDVKHPEIQNILAAIPMENMKSMILDGFSKKETLDIHYEPGKIQLQIGNKIYKGKWQRK